MASLSERVGTDAEHAGDQQKLKTLWKYAPTAYSGEHIVELPYVFYNRGTITVAPNPIGVTTLNQFKLNSIFDPDLTGSGNQPLGRDTYANIYDYYKVLETHVEVEIIDLTSRPGVTGSAPDGQYPSILGWMADITATPPASIITWLHAAEAGPMNKQQIFSRPTQMNVITGFNSNNKTYRSSYHWNAEDFDTAIIDGATKNTWTPVSSDPSNLNYFSLLASNPETTASGATRNFSVIVKMKYLVAFKTVNRTLLNTIN